MESLRFWFVAVLATVLLPSCTGADPYDYTKRPVLLVHGHGLDATDWSRFMRRLQDGGYPPAYLMAVNIVPNTMANRLAAETVLAPAVELLLQQAATAARDAGAEPPGAKIDIVAHSMGAVSGRWYATQLRPDRVAVFVSLGGANHGSSVLCGFADEGARELCPPFAGDPLTNPLQTSLNGLPGDGHDETPFSPAADPAGTRRVPPDEQRRITYYTLRIDPDAWIVPADSALLAGAGGPVAVHDPFAVETSPGNFLLRGNLVHDDMPWDRHCMSLVVRLLATGQ